MKWFKRVRDIKIESEAEKAARWSRAVYGKDMCGGLSRADFSEDVGNIKRLCKQLNAALNKVRSQGIDVFVSLDCQSETDAPLINYPNLVNPRNVIVRITKTVNL